MSVQHIPVMLNEVLTAFEVFKNRKDLVYLDGTYGRGGHFREIWRSFEISLGIVNDQDLTAIEQARIEWEKEISSGKIEVHHKNFNKFSEDNNPLDNHLSRNYKKLDMVLLDLGVSSPQLDEAQRGFSFNKDGPLDMRMNQQGKLSVFDIIQNSTEEELFNIFKTYGEIEKPARVIRAILNDREKTPFKNTLQLAGLIERVEGWKKKGFHPATQYFMALRLVVNEELAVVEHAIPRFIEQLQDGGRLVVITFHSLEDRIVKNLFKESTLGFAVNKKVIVPSDEECKINPRARSAKLRVFQKGLPPEKLDKFALRRQQREQN